MFRKVTIQGLKSIFDQEIVLDRINLLIGGNGAGKSNFLSAFQMAKAACDNDMDRWVKEKGGANGVLYLGRKHTDRIRLSFDLDRVSNRQLTGVRFNFAEAANSLFLEAVEESYGSDDRHLVTTQREVDDEAKSYFNSLRVYHFVDTGKTSPIKQDSNVNDNRFLRHDGGNLASVLFYISQTSPRRFKQIEDIIEEVAPFFYGFDLLPSKLNDSLIRLNWLQRGAADSYFDAEQLSDGTLRFICLVTLLMQPELPEVILIDEPELGLHPAALELLVSLIRKAASRSQLIISTQSVDLINLFNPEDVIVCENRGKGTIFKRLNGKDLDIWANDYSLGELWEKNVFGGNP